MISKLVDNRIEHLETSITPSTPKSRSSSTPLSLKVVRLGFNTIGRVFPGKASQIAFKLFGTPRIRARHKVSDAIIDSAKVSDISVDNLNEWIVIICNFNAALINLPFLEGSAEEVYKKLLTNDDIANYFNGIKFINNFINNTSAINSSNITLLYNFCSITEEAFSVYKHFSEDHNLTDVAYETFLVSSKNFDKFFNLEIKK